MLPIRGLTKNTESVDNSTVAVNITSGNAPIPPPSYSSSLHNDPTTVTPGQQTALNDVRDYEPNKSAMGASTQPVSSIPMAQPGMMSAPQPITHQPNPGFPGSVPVYQNPMVSSLSWMPVPPPDAIQAGCPPGLERLSQLQKVIIAPSVESQTVYQPGSQNKYLIKNDVGQVIFYAVEDNSAMRTNLYGFETVEMSLFDSDNQHVLRFSRVLATSTADCTCFHRYKVDVFCPPGYKIGSVIQQSVRRALEEVTDVDGNCQLSIKEPDPCCPFCPCVIISEGIDMQLLSKGEAVGRLYRPQPGVGNPSMMMEISFPKDLNAGVKASVLGFGVTMDAIIMKRLTRRQYTR